MSPILQVALARAAAGRMELIGSAQIGMGRTVFLRTQTPDTAETSATYFPESNLHLAYQVGPGLRVYAIKQFAVQMVTGVSGDHYFSTKDSPSGLRAVNQSSLGLFGNLGVLGIF